MSAEKVVSNFNKTAAGFLNNKNMSMGLKALLIIYAGFSVPKLMGNHVQIFDNVLVRVLVAGLVVYLSFHDTTLSLLLAICLVLSIQELNKLKTTSAINNMQDMESFDGHHDGHDDGEMLDENLEQFQSNQQSDNSGEQSNELTSGGLCRNSGVYFTNDNQLNDAQNNNVESSNTMSQVQSWENQLGPQGLNHPYGFSGPNQNNASSRPSVGQFASEF